MIEGDNDDASCGDSKLSAGSLLPGGARLPGRSAFAAVSGSTGGG